MSEYNKKRWKDPVYREKMTKHLSDNNERIWGGRNGEENRKVLRERTIELWKDKKFRTKMRKVHRSSKFAKAIKESLDNLSSKEKSRRYKLQSKVQKDKWKDKTWVASRLKKYKSKQFRKKLSEANKRIWTVAKRKEHSIVMKAAGKKISKTNRRNYATGKRRPVKTNRSNFKSGFIDSKKGGRFYSKSSWEEKIAKLLDKSKLVLSFIYEPFPLRYRFDGKNRSFFPDFLVKLKDGNKVLLELKGWADSKTKYKKRAAKRYCKKNKAKLCWLTKMPLSLSEIL